MSGRREPQCRVAPDPITFHKINARRLRLEARRETCRRMQTSIADMIRKIFRRRGRF
jgi:hypothetical protein